MKLLRMKFDFYVPIPFSLVIPTAKISNVKSITNNEMNDKIMYIRHFYSTTCELSADMEPLFFPFSFVPIEAYLIYITFIY